MSAASIKGPRRERPAPPAPPRLTPTTAFAAPPPLPAHRRGAPPPLAPPAMPKAVERVLGATVKIERRPPRTMRGFVLGAVIGATLVFALAGSDRLRDARASLAGALRNLKTQRTQAELTGVGRAAPQAIETPASMEPATYTVPTPANTIPTYDVRDLPQVTPTMPGRRTVPSLNDRNGDERRGDEARLDTGGGPEKALFRPDPAQRARGRAL